jgi:phage shock protein A
MEICSEILNSWKEIAVYLGRGVRTVQRWEKELHLPVRRPRNRSRSAVIALRAELNEWLVRQAAQRENNGNCHHVESNAVLLRQRMNELREELRMLEDKLEQIEGQHHQRLRLVNKSATNTVGMHI